jgi:hypothetical protein
LWCQQGTATGEGLKAGAGGINAGAKGSLDPSFHGHPTHIARRSKRKQALPMFASRPPSTGAGAPGPLGQSETGKSLHSGFAAWSVGNTEFIELTVNEVAKIRTPGSPFAVITDRSVITLQTLIGKK